MRMPFGKYKDEDLDDIPDGYLRWVLDNVNDLDWSLRRAIMRRLDSPRQPPPYSPPSGPKPTDARRLAEIVRDSLRSAYRETAARFHPDHGGSNEKMIGVNALYERLDETLDRRLRELDGR